ncbi:MAG: Uma2 family endonuclease, partial [Bacteroidota bacterium]
MGSSSLQFVIINYFIRLFARELDEDQYYIAASEAGVHIDHQSNLANDIAIYESSVLTPDKINEHYASVAPKIVIEVDIKADLSELQDYDYVPFKTKKLLDFGTE